MESELTPRTTPSLPEFADEKADLHKSTHEILDVAEEYFKKGQLGKAEQILQQLLLQDTREPRVFYSLGTIYYDQGKHHRAEVAFKRCLDLNAEHRDAAVALAILYNDLGEYEKAEEVYKHARLGVEHVSRGRDIHLEQVLGQKHEDLGDLYFEHEFYNDAFQEFEKAAKHRPQELDLVIKAAKSLEKAGVKQAAIEKLKELRSAFPEHLPARLALGMVYFNSHRIPEAVAEWEAVLRRDPNQKEAKLYIKVATQSSVTSV